MDGCPVLQHGPPPGPSGFTSICPGRCLPWGHKGTEAAAQMAAINVTLHVCHCSLVATPRQGPVASGMTQNLFHGGNPYPFMV